MYFKTRHLLFSGFICVAIWAGMAFVACEPEVRRDTSPILEPIKIETVKTIQEPIEDTKKNLDTLVTKIDSIVTKIEVEKSKLTRKELREQIKKELLLNYPRLVTK